MDNDIKYYTASKLTHAVFDRREHENYHHSYDEELLQYEYLRDGDMRSIEESKRMFRSGITGKLSKDPVRDKKYLFVAAITLATRFAIEGGMESSFAYDLSDYYIMTMDDCTSVDEVCELETAMFEDFTSRMADIHKHEAVRFLDNDYVEGMELDISKPLAACIDYIHLHLHSKITIKELGEACGLSPNHLNHKFKKETGMTLQQYIRRKRIEAAKNMLLYTNYSLTEIGQFLAFSSTSHFIQVFKDEVGTTPKEYAKENFRRHERWGVSASE